MHNHEWVTTDEAEESITQECCGCPARRRIRRVVVETVVDMAEWLDTGGTGRVRIA